MDGILGAQNRRWGVVELMGKVFAVSPRHGIDFDEMQHPRALPELDVSTNTKRPYFP